MIGKKYDGSEPSYLYQIGHNLQAIFAATPFGFHENQKIIEKVWKG